MEYREFRAMNTDVVLAAEGDRGALEQGFEQARKYIQASEQRFTRFTDTSELSALNRATGEWVMVSADMYELLQQAVYFYHLTGGLFDPSILDKLEAAGYDRSMDEIRARGVGEAKSIASPVSHSRTLMEFDADKRSVRLPRGVRIDLGGIAKGWIAERGAHIIAEFATACAVNAGGDLFSIGLPEGESGWTIGVEDPRNPGEILAVLRVQPGAVATSSVTKRRWQQGPKTMHHLIDPRTGLPAETDWLSVTAIAPNATAAEVLAKSLLIAGSQRAGELASHQHDLAFFAVDANGQIWSKDDAGVRLGVGVEYN